MKLFKHIAISIFLTAGILCAVFYASCSKDACKGVTCLNNAACGGGTCLCDSGIGGVNCETVYRNLYAYTYKGVVNLSGNLDTVHTIDSNCVNYTLSFAPNTTDTMNYRTMTVTWNDNASKLLLTMPITLANNSAAGSAFTVPSVNSDTFTYAGYGNVSTASASLVLTRTHAHGSSKVTLTFNSFSRQ